MKATGRAHPIQGLVKYHGLRDPARNVPYHDSISVCTAPSETRTTVAFGQDADTCLVDGDPVDDEGFDRVTTVLDAVRDRAGLTSGARVESVNTFASNVGLGASASAYAALAVAATAAAGLSLSRRELSALARQGATSAARSVPGGYAQLRARLPAHECVGERLDAPFTEEVRMVVGMVPAYKQTSRAHAETPASPFFDARLAAVHETLAEARDAIHSGDFARTFALAERDSLRLLATTMTGPDGWLYWRPETVRLYDLARHLRDDGVPVYFSADTGATAYLNTTASHADRVVEAVEEVGLESHVWHVGGPAERVDDHLF
jgi:phosphomevalonate decarboxylase